MRRRFGVHQIGDSFGFRKIEFAVFKGAARELARLRQSKFRSLTKPFDERVKHGPAAVNVKLGDVFARETMRRGEPKR